MFDVFSRINEGQKRRFYEGFLTTANNEKQFCTTRVGVRVGVSFGVRTTGCIASLSVRLYPMIEEEECVVCGMRAESMHKRKGPRRSPFRNCLFDAFHTQVSTNDTDIRLEQRLEGGVEIVGGITDHNASVQFPAHDLRLIPILPETTTQIDLAWRSDRGMTEEMKMFMDIVLRMKPMEQNN